MNELYSDFIIKLKKRFGRFDEEQKRFEKASNSEIARELGYSDAQFSRLINLSATAGEYQRAIQNLDRILLVAQLENELKSLSPNGRDWKRSKLWMYGTAALIILIVWLIILDTSTLKRSSDTGLVRQERDDMLRWTFETSFVNPYTRLDDLPIDCSYPCYKYQGKWGLKKGYKIPFFRERSGFHYWAIEVNMYARCMSEKNETGDLLEGYEYQKHEIWYDKKELPIDSFLNDDSSLKAFYIKMDFEKEPDFVKVATAHTFFRNEFKIDTVFIHRTGKVIGRDLEFVSDELLDDLLSEEVKKNIEGELNRIATNRLQDFSRPISCQDAPVPTDDFHQIREGDEMSFECQLTTNRVAVDYTKTFVLKDQYIKNVCR